MSVNKIRLVISLVVLCVLILIVAGPLLPTKGYPSVDSDGYYVMDDEALTNPCSEKITKELRKRLLQLKGKELAADTLCMARFNWYMDGRIGHPQIEAYWDKNEKEIPCPDHETFRQLQDILVQSIEAAAPVKPTVKVRASVLDIFCFCEPSKKQCIYLAVLPTNVVKPYRIPGAQDDSLPEQRDPGSYSYFFIDRSGRQVTDCYDFARSFSNGVAPVKKQHKWGVIGQDGCLTSPFLLDDIQPFHNGLAVAKQRGRYGFVESTGKWRVLPQFSLAKRFSEDRAAVRLDDFRWRYIDRDGKFIIPASFNNAEPFSEGSAQASGIDWAEWRNFDGYINRSGTFRIRQKFSKSTPFSCGVAIVQSAETTDVIMINSRGQQVQHAGQLIVPEVAHDALLRIANKHNRIGYISTSGKLLIPCKFSYDQKNFAGTGWFSEGLAAVKLIKYSYVNLTGSIAIKGPFDFAGPFNEGLAPVRLGNKFGYIAKSGKLVIPARFDLALPFHEGRAIVGQKFQSGIHVTRGNLPKGE
jgi:hypothetical protein